MGHTFSDLLYHVVFSTKYRQNLLYKDMREGLFAYIGGVVRNENGILLRANGIDDHIHLLIKIKPSQAPADMIKKVKANSSRWIKETIPDLPDFAWQSGYGIFSVSESGFEKVSEYIRDQELHHHTLPYADELKAVLDAHNVEYHAEHYLD